MTITGDCVLIVVLACCIIVCNKGVTVLAGWYVQYIFWPLDGAIIIIFLHGLLNKHPQQKRFYKSLAKSYSAKETCTVNEVTGRRSQEVKESTFILRL